MPYKILNKRGEWLVQVQRQGVRRTRRGKGGEAKAKQAEAALMVEVDQIVQRRQAAEVLGLDPGAMENTKTACAAPLTLAEFLKTRWAAHAALVHNDATRRNCGAHVRYIAYFLGDRRIDEIGVADVNQMVESMHEHGPISFKLCKDGKPRRRSTRAFSPGGINRIMSTLRAVLNLAAAEGVIEKAPRVGLRPDDNSRSIVPPTETELDAIVEASKGFTEIAPFFPEVIRLAAETGLRAAELFHLCWRSVDFEMGDTGGIRIEEQQRTRIVGGKPWKPKNLKFRIVPLTPLARSILDELHTKVPKAPAELVIPNRGGGPYLRLENAPRGSGKGWWHDVLESCELKGRVRFHDLRHLFAVRCLQRGVPLAVVSAWLGHSDVNLTVKRYGRWSSEAREQWEWIKKLDKPIDAIARTPWLTVHEGGR